MQCNCAEGLHFSAFHAKTSSTLYIAIMNALVLQAERYLETTKRNAKLSVEQLQQRRTNALTWAWGRYNGYQRTRRVSPACLGDQRVERLSLRKRCSTKVQFGILIRRSRCANVPSSVPVDLVTAESQVFTQV